MEVLVSHFQPIYVLDGMQGSLSISVINKAHAPTPGCVLLLQHLHAQDGAMRGKPTVTEIVSIPSM